MRPVDRVAARVIRKGVHFAPANRMCTQVRFDAPPPMRVISEMLPGGPLAGMIGRRRGRLVVVGLLAAPISKRASWVVRCDCGGYELRKAIWVKTASDDAKCQECHYLASLQWKTANEGKW